MIGEYNFISKKGNCYDAKVALGCGGTMLTGDNLSFYFIATFQMRGLFSVISVPVK